MITIPACELVRLLATATGFAAPDKEQHWFGVLIEWDGESLHASGFDTLSGARVTWTPYEGAEAMAEESSPYAQTKWGAAYEDTWRVFINVLAAKEIVKTFKLPAKHALTPVTVKVTATGSGLLVERNRDTGHSQHLGMWPNDPERAAKFPDIREIAGDEASTTRLVTPEMRFNPIRLAAFAAAPDTLTMRFGVEGSPTAVTAGERFVGFIYPAGANVGGAVANAAGGTE